MKKIRYFKNGRDMLANDMPGSNTALTKDGWSTTPPKGWKEPLPTSEAKNELDDARETIAKLESDLDFLIDAKKKSDEQLAELAEQVTQTNAKNLELVTENLELIEQVTQLTAPPKDAKASASKGK